MDIFDGWMIYWVKCGIAEFVWGNFHMVAGLYWGPQRAVRSSLLVKPLGRGFMPPEYLGTIKVVRFYANGWVFLSKYFTIRRYSPSFLWVFVIRERAARVIYRLVKSAHQCGTQNCSRKCQKLNWSYSLVNMPNATIWVKTLKRIWPKRSGTLIIICLSSWHCHIRPPEIGFGWWRILGSSWTLFPISKVVLKT